MMKGKQSWVGIATLAHLATLTSAFTCNANAAATYKATIKYQGCYNDSSVNILSSAKISSIIVSPQQCGTFCGEKGFAYAGIDFGTQCLCGHEPHLTAENNKLKDSECFDACTLDPSQSCGGPYIQSLYKVLNPAKVTESTAFTPACQTSPLCSHKVCDTSMSIAERVASLVNALTVKEKIDNLVDTSAGSPRLGLPPYEWWSEATHGVGSAPGVEFTAPGNNFSYATSFPAPILSSAAFDDELTYQIGQVVGREGRAFGNNGFAGFDYWAPNMNPFRVPQWGRGQETPGEDVLRVQNYVKSYVTGLQGPDVMEKQVISTCKHYAAYDVETGRYGNDFNPTVQDLADYFLAPFKTCVRDVNVGSVMCSYNAVDGVPSCANTYLLQEVLRDTWGFTADYNYVVSDCGAVTDIWQFHNFTNTEEAAASVALNAGTDIECGTSYLKLNSSLADGQTTVARMDQALTRLYHALFTVGFFDGSQYSSLGWSDVATSSAQTLAYTAAVEGMTLLKNDDEFLPLMSKSRKVAVVGPFANATTQLQGDYSGTAKYLISPLAAFQKYSSWKVKYAEGTSISGNDTSGFAAATAATSSSDVVIFCGGIDNSLEAEGIDRATLTWPGEQLNLISKLAKTKPVIVVQFGGGQLDDSPLLNNPNVKAVIWAGYPSQDGGQALLDVLVGKQSIAGRLPVTQYPASYEQEVSKWDINLRPSGAYPGRTYRWYTGKPVLPFGYGLSYTTFDFSWGKKLQSRYDIQQLVDSCRTGSAAINDSTPFASVSASVRNCGKHASDYVGLLFLSSPNAGPAPRPIKTLVSYSRLHNIAVDKTQKLNLPLTLGSLARADKNGDLTIFPGTYKLVLDVDEKLEFSFTLTGQKAVIDTLPMPTEKYNSTVPVHIQPPSTTGVVNGA